MEMDASFGEWWRSTSHVLSFSTSVLVFRGIAMQISLPFGYRCFVVKEKWSCFADRFSVVSYPPLPLPPHPTLFFSFALIFFYTYFTLNWAAKKREKGVKNQQRGSIRPSSVCEVCLLSIWRKASEWRRNETKLLPVTFDPAISKSPWRREERGCRGWELQTPSSDLSSALVSFETWLVFIKLFRSAVQGHSLTN